MKIEINTKDGEGQICDMCPFMDNDFLDRVGTCLLFKETLRPNYAHGDVESWNTCDQCQIVHRQTLLSD